jgi:hypothetical protein
MSSAYLRQVVRSASSGVPSSGAPCRDPIPDVVSRQIAIAIALLAALGVLVAAMAVSTAARASDYPPTAASASLPVIGRL